jgi:hypothetical protein
MNASTGSSLSARLRRAVVALALVATGAGLESLRTRAQTTSPTINGSFRHLGFVVRDIDQAAGRFAGVFGASYNPVHEAGGLVYPDDFTGDRKTVIRTTEVRTNGFEFHLLQPIGGASSWHDHLEKYGDGSLQHISFGVVDLAGTVKALEKLGGKVTTGRGDSFFAYVALPQVPFSIELEKIPR